MLVAYAAAADQVRVRVVMAGGQLRAGHVVVHRMHRMVHRVMHAHRWVVMRHRHRHVVAHARVVRRVVRKVVLTLGRVLLPDGIGHHVLARCCAPQACSRDESLSSHPLDIWFAPPLQLPLISDWFS